MNGSIELELNGRKVTVMGGRYLDKPAGVRGVKLAKEIDAPADVVLDIPDFGVPAHSVLNQPLYETLKILDEDGQVYIGCMGGIGRTGMFIAILLRCIGIEELNRAEKTWWGKLRIFFKQYPSTNENGYMVYEPVKYVRAVYLPAAIETKEQERLVASYDPGPMLIARDLHSRLNTE